MKRLISLVTALLFMSGMVMAQSNQAFVTQVGTNDTANVTQTGANNYAKYSVNGNNNEFVGIQDNSEKEEAVGNDMKVDQGNWYDAGENDDNYTRAVQLGDANDLDAILKGDRNEITFKQEGFANVIKGFGNQPANAWTDDPFIYEGDDSWIHIEQVGAFNLVQGDIRASNQVVDVYQESATELDDNISEIFVRGSLGDPATQTIDVDQVGKNYSDIDIWGNGNEVTHDQYGRDPDGNAIGQNDAFTHIYGDDNMSRIEQEGGNEGTRNFAMHKMGDSESKVSGNEARTKQDGRANYAFVQQMTDDNYARQVQDAWKGVPGAGDATNEAERNHSSIIQMGGDYNMAETYQFGDDNSVDILQYGTENVAITDQGIWDQERPSATGMESSHGDDNFINIYQEGMGQMTHVIQKGFSNSATVTQTP